MTALCLAASLLADAGGQDPKWSFAGLALTQFVTLAGVIVTAVISQRGNNRVGVLTAAFLAHLEDHSYPGRADAHKPQRHRRS
jgi:hypothetical protein